MLWMRASASNQNCCRRGLTPFLLETIPAKERISETLPPIPPIETKGCRKFHQQLTVEHAAREAEDISRASVGSGT
jgi:hypothetical protein